MSIYIDESTDTSGRFIGNVVTGTLEFDQPGKIFLLTTYGNYCKS